LLAVTVAGNWVSAGRTGNSPRASARSSRRLGCQEVSLKVVYHQVIMASAFRSSYSPSTQLNWLSRYLPMKPHLEEESFISLLEVGSGHVGISSIISTPFVGIEIEFAYPTVETMIPIEYDGERIPFADNSFHTVVSNHTLEHVPPFQRPFFISELLRVSSNRVLLGFPADNLAEEADKWFQSIYEALFSNAPTWLYEHNEHGIPASADVQRFFGDHPEWSFERQSCSNSLWEILCLLGDTIPSTSAWFKEALTNHPLELEQLFTSSLFGKSSNCLYRLNRNEATNPHVNLSQLDTIISSLKCPICFSSFHLLQQKPIVASCSECGLPLSRTSMGALNFHR